MAPWLRDTEYGRILTNSNRLLDAQLPLDKLPICSRNVSLRFIIGNAYYVIAFAVGDGTPEVNLDLPHQGRRGGTMRTRYFGRLEGVSLPGGRELYEPAVFADAGIELRFLPDYAGPHASILTRILHEDRDDLTREILATTPEARN